MIDKIRETCMSKIGNAEEKRNSIHGKRNEIK